MRHRLWVLTFLLVGIILAVRSTSANAEAVPDDASRGRSSFHVEIGGQNDVPGGTFGLGQQTSATSLMFERSDMFGDIGLALRYLNEGYLGPQNAPAPMPLASPLHYKDTFALLATHWWSVNAPCRLGGGLGVETYFDTTATKWRADYGDRHGLGVQLNIAGQCELTRRLSIELTATRSFDVASFDSSAVLLGFVFTPKDCDAVRGLEESSLQPRGHVEVAAGRVDIDDFDVSHDDGTTTWLSYGRSLNGPFGFDVSLLRERVANVVDRRGVALEFTAEHSFWVDWFHVFAGAGAYLAHSIDYDLSRSATQVNLLISYGLRISIGRRFSVMVKLGRVAASAGRNDSDLATVGFAIAAP